MPRSALLISDRERRARLALRHGLAASARSQDVTSAVRGVVGLHSSDPVTVYLSAAQRMRAASIGAIDEALYEQRLVMRHHAMRRTLWVLPLDLAMAAHSSSTSALVKPERTRLANALAASGVTDDPHEWIDDACTVLLRELARRGEASTRELGDALPQYTIPVSMSPAGVHATAVPAHTRLLVLLGFVGATIRTRPIGSWISGQYRWSLASEWTGRRWTDDALPIKSDAQATIVDAYLKAFGPATERDVTWWTGWPKAHVIRAVKAVGAVEVETEHGRAFVAADDLGTTDEPEPWVALLPGLDPTAMGWKERSWYVDDRLIPSVFDRSGNAGPTIWADGHVVGAWAQRTDGSIAVHTTRHLSTTHQRLLDDEIERVRQLVGDARFRTRFPSPWSRQLAASLDQ